VTGIYDWNPMPHVLDVRCPSCCGRYDEQPSSAEACFAILDDKGVKMNITVQQMVMSAVQGWLSARPGR